MTSLRFAKQQAKEALQQVRGEVAAARADLAEARAGEEREATVDFFSRPHVMGVLNATPDSFSDGGELVRARGGARCPGLRDN